MVVGFYRLRGHYQKIVVVFLFLEFSNHRTLRYNEHSNLSKFTERISTVEYRSQRYELCERKTNRDCSAVVPRNSSSRRLRKARIFQAVSLLNQGVLFNPYPNCAPFARWFLIGVDSAQRGEPYTKIKMKKLPGYKVPIYPAIP